MKQPGKKKKILNLSGLDQSGVQRSYQLPFQTHNVLKQLPECSAVSAKGIRGPRTVSFHPVRVKPLYSCSFTQKAVI